MKVVAPNVQLQGKGCFSIFRGENTHCSLTPEDTHLKFLGSFFPLRYIFHFRYIFLSLPN